MPFVPEEINIDSTTAAGLDYTVYAVDEATADATNVNHLRILTDGSLKDGRTSIEIADGTAAATGLVVAFSGGEDNAAVIRSVSAVGTRVR